MNTDRGSTFSVQMRAEGGDVVVTVAGEVDLNSAPALRAALLDAVGVAAREVTVDMYGVDYFDSSGVHGIFDSADIAHGAEKQLRLVRVRPHLMRLLDMTGVPAIILCEEATDEA